MLQISGSALTPVKLKLSYQQYEQLLDMLESLMPQPASEETILSSSHQLGGIKEKTELHTGVSKFNIDPALRERMLNVSSGKQKVENQRTLRLKGNVFISVGSIPLHWKHRKSK
jgi:hypothetical protein